MKDLIELKDMLCSELMKYGKKGDLSAGGLEVVQKLASAVNNLDKIIECEEGSYSNRGAYRMDGTYDGYSHKRDRMGRYSRDGYSMHSDLVEELRDLMHEAPDERTKSEFRKFINKMEQM